MQGLSAELSAALRYTGLPDAQISGTLKRVGQGMVRRFGGQHTYVPKGRACAHDAEEKAFSLKQQGVSTPDIAKRMDLTPRRVQQLIRNARDRRR